MLTEEVRVQIQKTRSGGFFGQKVRASTMNPGTILLDDGVLMISSVNDQLFTRES
jgi:hypothetical protein